MDPKLSQLDDRMLQSFAFHLTRSRDMKKRDYMNEHYVFSSQFPSQLSQRFDKMRTFNISYCSSNFDDSYIFPFRSSTDPIFHFIGDMRDHLNGLSEIFSFSLFLDDRKINLSGRNTTISRQFFIDKSLIMSKIQISLKAILGHKGFPMLKRRHRSRIDLQIRIQFHHRYAMSR